MENTYYFVGLEMDRGSFHVVSDGILSEKWNTLDDVLLAIRTNFRCKNILVVKRGVRGTALSTFQHPDTIVWKHSQARQIAMEHFDSWVRANREYFYDTELKSLGL